jgi:hypothetical protein
MTHPLDRQAIAAQAEQKVAQILGAASSWAKEAPEALGPAVRAVCIRLGEMVADQRHYLTPLPEPQESERKAMLGMVAERLASAATATGVEKELNTLSELELKSTGSWALIPAAQAEWITTAIRFLQTAAAALPAELRPDVYWAEDVVAGIIVSVRAVVGIDELHARTEAQYSGQGKAVREDEESDEEAPES